MAFEFKVEAYLFMVLACMQVLDLGFKWFLFIIHSAIECRLKNVEDLSERYLVRDLLQNTVSTNDEKLASESKNDVHDY